jgi:signal transduction histidine kinase/ligand-binding sensor domain-containing protein
VVSIASRSKYPLFPALILGAVVSTLCATTAFGGGRFDNWSTENGLPQNSVNAMVQTRDGYLWLATNGGLVRYDGVRFTVFNTSNTSGITSNRLHCLAEAGDGALWIGTEDSGIIRYKDGFFSAYSTADGLPRNHIDAIQTGDDGSVVIVMNAAAVEWQDGRFQAYPYGSMSLNPRSPPLFYKRDNGIHFLNEPGSPLLDIPASVLQQPLTAIYVDRQRAIWIATRTHLNRYKGGRLETFTVKNGLPDSAVNCFWEDTDGGTWMGTDAGGAVRLSNGAFTTYTTADGLSSNSITAFYQDREGSMWIGTSDRGLNRLKRQMVTSYSERDGLIGKHAYPIYQDRDGAIWIGCAGLHRYQDGKFERYVHLSEAHTAKFQLPYADTTALSQSSDGRLWIGEVGGLFWMKDGQYTPIQLERPSPFVWVIHQSSDGRMWFGTDRGLFSYNDGKLVKFNTRDGLAGDDVKAIVEDSQGALWLGTYGGLSYYHDGKFVSYTTRDGLPSDRVRSLFLDAKGVLWVGAYDGGLARFSEGKFTRYAVKDGLFDSVVFQILEDEQHNMWMSCNRGIYRTSKQQLEDFAIGKISRIACISYGVEDGMLNSECNGGRQPAGIKARDGKLWFPTLDGVAVIDPSAVPVNTQPPPVAIEEAALDREDISVKQPITAPPGKQNLEIHYTALSFINPDKVNFKFRMEGLDRDWVEVGTRRAAYYSHLPPGNYVFRVIAANSDGVWNEQGASIRIVVIPPIWRTWWFVTLMSAAVVAAVIFTFRQRMAALEKRNRAQSEFARRLIESQEIERKRIAAELHDGLGQNLLVIRNRALLGLNGDGDQDRARIQLDEISSTALQAIEEVRTIAHNLRPYQLDRLGLTTALQATIRRVSESSTISFSVDIDSVDGLFSAEGEINLYRIVQESVNNIIKHSRATEATVSIKRDDATINIVVKDNGVGFVVEPGLRNGGGMGLTGISERVRIMGGRLATESAPGKGTTVTVQIPAQAIGSRGGPEGGIDEQPTT